MITNKDQQTAGNTALLMSPLRSVTTLELAADWDRLEDAFSDWMFSSLDVRLLELQKDQPINLEILVESGMILRHENGLFTLNQNWDQQALKAG